MKSLMMLVFLVFSQMTFAAPSREEQPPARNTFKCGGDMIDDYMVVLADQVRISCSDGYYMAINGIGIGLRYGGAMSGYVVSCITNTTASDLTGIYYGVKADTALMIGLSGSFFVGQKGACAVGGANAFSVGAGLSISSMQIYKRPQSR